MSGRLNTTPLQVDLERSFSRSRLLRAKAVSTLVLHIPLSRPHRTLAYSKYVPIASGIVPEVIGPDVP